MALPKRHFITGTTTFKRSEKGAAYVTRMEQVVDSHFDIPLGMAQEVRNEFMSLFEQELRKQLRSQIEHQKAASAYPSDEHGEFSDDELLHSLDIRQKRNSRGGDTDVLDIEFGEGLPYAANINKPEGESTLIFADEEGLMTIPNRKEMEAEVISVISGARNVTPKYFKQRVVEYPGHATFTKSLMATVRHKKSLQKKAVEQTLGRTFKKGENWKSYGDYIYSREGEIKYNVRGANGRYIKKGT